MTRMLRVALVAASLCILAFAFSSSASATVLSPTPDPLTGSNFQGGDGNELAESGHSDWQTLASVPPGGSGFVANSPDSTTHDSCFGSPNQKQLNPGGWVFIDCGSGVSPAKTNLLAGWSSIDQAGDTFLDLAFTREVQTGNTYLAFELNQQSGTFHNPAGYDVPCRTGDGNGPGADDLIISYQVESGGSPPNVDIVVHRWKTLTASSSDPRHCALTGSVDELDPQPYAEGAVNAGSIANYLNGGSPANFLPGTFGEAALNLSGFFRSYLADRPCFSFGSISMESHSSTSFTSDLKDFIGPTPLSVANCKINVDKQVRVRTGSTPSDPTTDSYSDSDSAVVGSTFDYRFDVSVPAGSRALTLTDIYDVLGTQTSDPSFCAPQAYLGGNAPHNYGDANDDDIVDPGEHWLFTCSHTSDAGDVAASPLHNTVFVEGKVPGCTGAVADCGASDDDDASATVQKAQPGIATTAATPVTVGDDISDSATVSGGYSPSGQVRFDLYAPADANCLGTPVFTSTKTLTASGTGTFTATSDTYTTTSTGDYHWIASYLGNASDKAVAGTCGDPGETSHVDKANPGITTVASPATDLGQPIHDTAHVSGYNPSGSVTFTVYGPNDANCSGTGVVVGSGPLDASGNAGSPDYTPTAVGTYRWIASYSGDANNNTTSGTCNDAGESVDVRQPLLAIEKTGPDHAYDGDVITFDITVTNPGSSDVHDVQLTDQINGTTHGCDSISGPTGDTNGDSVLQPSETWTYVCTYTVQHADEDATHHVVNTATVQGKNSSGDTVGPVSDDAPVLILHPAIAIDKSGPAEANAGDKVAYTLTVTNPGDDSFAEATVKVQDAQCNGDPVTLIGKGGDTSPASLDPGDTWTYSCSVQTTAGQTSIHNVGSVTGCDQYGKCVSAEDPADTVLAAQLVLPERITPGTAKLVGASGCQARAFNARIRGSKIATVTFVLDGKVVKKVKNAKNARLISYRVQPGKLRIGVHRLVVNVTFQAGSGTKPKTLRLSFQRCTTKLVTPRFTG